MKGSIPNQKYSVAKFYARGKYSKMREESQAAGRGLAGRRVLKPLWEYLDLPIRVLPYLGRRKKMFFRGESLNSSDKSRILKSYSEFKWRSLRND
jgi:hypothetical protein